MARLINETGAEAVVDIFEIEKGDPIEQRIREELPGCDELVALITPWSVERKWVWTEIGSAWVLRKRLVAVLHGLTLDAIGRDHGGAACLSSTNITSLNEFDGYLAELKVRVMSGPKP